MKRIVYTNLGPIEFELEFKKIKNLNMHINRDGVVLVSAPLRMPLANIDSFINAKAKWIIKSKEEVLKKKQDLSNSSYLMYLGEKKRMIIINSSKNYCKWDSEGNLEVHLDDYNKFDSVLYKFLKNEIKRILTNVFDQIYDLFMFDYSFEKPDMKIRKMTSRYGSCSPRIGLITLNETLIHYDMQFIRYVVIHEFAHMIEPNHSKGFYAVVSKYMPNYKEVFERGAKFDL